MSGSTGVKNLKLAPGGEVEVKAGARYQKKIYRARRCSSASAGASEVDTVRITWPNGLIQNETRQPAGERLRLTRRRSASPARAR